jgi:hypothetical protein
LTSDPPAPFPSPGGDHGDAVVAAPSRPQAARATESNPWWDQPIAVPGARPRLAIFVMLLGLLSPGLLGIDRLVGPYSSAQTRWSYRIASRVEARAARLDSRKILFVGGSNLTFGIHAPALESELGVPVLDYAVNAGIGLDLIADRAARLIGPGDAVVVAPEFNHFMPPGPIDAPLRRDWLGLFDFTIPDPLVRFPMRPWVAIRERSRGIIATVEGALANTAYALRRGRLTLPDPGITRPYDLRAIDENGNLAFSRRRRIMPAPYVLPLADPALFDFEHSEGVDGLRILAEACRARGALLYVMPPIWTLGPRPADNEGLPAVMEREADIIRTAERFGARQLLGPGQTVLPASDAYDRTYHINDHGVVVMQERLLAALRPIAESMRSER